jgi:hypothetical protein
MMFCYDRHGIPHLAPISNIAFSNVGRTVFHVSATMVRSAVNTLDRISTGDVDTDRERMIDDAHRVADDLWRGKEIWRQILSHPTYAHLDVSRANTVAPMLSDHPLAVWWVGAILNGKIIVEFSATAPLENISVFSFVRMGRAGAKVVEVCVGPRGVDAYAVNSQGSAPGYSMEIDKY